MLLIARIVLTAVAFIAVLPAIPGFTFHGTLFQALLLAILFSIILWIVDVVAVALSALIAVSTLGLALLWLIPLWVLGFWLLPAVALKVVSDLMPNYMHITGWLPAVLGGIVMLIIGMITSQSVWRHAQV